MAIAGWYRDPSGFAEARYWDGVRWTDQVTNSGGVTSTAPMATGVDTPPVAGSEFRAQATASAEPAKASSSSPIGPILAGLAMLVAVIALIIALTNGDGDDADDGDPTPTPTSEEPESTETTEGE